MDSPKHPSTHPRDLALLIPLYIGALRVRHYSETTLYTREAILGSFARFCLARHVTDAQDVFPALILDYQSELCLHRKRNEKPLALGTQVQRLIAVTEFFGYLCDEALIAADPTSGLILPRSERRLPKNVLNPAEIEKLLDWPATTTPLGLRDRTILECFYSTGLRRQELCQLDIAHIDFADQTVRVEHGKGGKDRVVPIGERALRWLNQYLANARPALKPTPGFFAIFLDTLGRRLSPGLLGNHVCRLIRRALPGKTGGCHVLRHAFATGLLRNGCNIRHIQAMLGHTKLETTALYTHVSIRELIEAHRRFHPASTSTSTAPPSSADHGNKNAATSPRLARAIEELKALPRGKLGTAAKFIHGLLQIAEAEALAGGQAAAAKTP